MLAGDTDQRITVREDLDYRDDHVFIQDVFDIDVHLNYIIAKDFDVLNRNILDGYVYILNVYEGEVDILYVQIYKTILKIDIPETYVEVPLCCGLSAERGEAGCRCSSRCYTFQYRTSS